MDATVFRVLIDAEIKKEAAGRLSKALSGFWTPTSKAGLGRASCSECRAVWPSIRTKLRRGPLIYKTCD